MHNLTVAQRAEAQQHAERVTLLGLSAAGLVGIITAPLAPVLLPVGAAMLTSAAVVRLCGVGK